MRSRFYGNQFIKTSAIERFWHYVDKGNKDECWIWKGRIFPKSGYGQFWVKNDDGKVIDRSAHRFSWKIHFGEVPNGLLVCHKCDNPSCVNPNHLFLGTQFDNIQDKCKKNRQAKGSKIGNSKLKEEDVIAILGLHSSGRTKISISDEFDVSYALIKRITRREIWRHINYENSLVK